MLIIAPGMGADLFLAVKWSVVEHGSTSTTDRSGHPTIVPAPFWICEDPLCVGTGCILAIFCSGGGGGSGVGGIIPGFNGFPPPQPPSNPPPGSEGDSPNPSTNANPSITESPRSSTGSSTSSVSTTATSSNECSSIITVADAGPTFAGDPDDGSRRLLRLRRHNNLVAREAPVINRIGTCTLTNAVNIPLFLGYRQAMNLAKQPNNGANGAIYSAVEKWYAENLAIDGTPFSGVKIDNAFTEVTGPGSTDHVWEKSNLADFFSSILGSQFDCDDLNALFSSCGVSLQTLYNQLPSMDAANVQTGFAFMNRNLNGMKGWMFSQGFADPRFNRIYNTNEKIMQGLQRQAIVFNLFNTDHGIQSMHDQTNNRVYSILSARDDYVSTHKVHRANTRGDLTQKFAPTFKTWYSQLLANTGKETYDWASDQVTRLDEDKTLPACLQRAISNFKLSPLYGTYICFFSKASHFPQLVLCLVWVAWGQFEERSVTKKKVTKTPPE